MNANGTQSLSPELAELLSPVPIGTFLEEYWGRKPLCIRGAEAKFRGIFDVERLKAVPSSSPDGLLHASADRGKTLTKIEPAEVDSTYAKGSTVCATHVQEASAPLKALCEALEAQLRYPGIIDARAYLSPHGTGFDLHYDARVTTTLQLEGCKRWRYSVEPEVVWPETNRWVGAANHDGKATAFEEVALRPGDVLCLPAGTWHSARAEGHSLAVNVAIIPVDFFGLAAERMQADLRQHAFWREPVPPAGPAEGARALPAAVRDYLALRFTALAKWCGGIADDPRALEEFWYASLVRTRRAGNASAAQTELANLTPNDVVMLKKNVHAYHVMQEEGTRPLVVYFGPPARKLSLPLGCRELVEDLLAGRKLTAAAAQTRLGVADWPSADGVLRRLIASGLVELDGPAGAAQGMG